MIHDKFITIPTSNMFNDDHNISLTTQIVVIAYLD
jgi:hypothetical protein